MTPPPLSFDLVLPLASAMVFVVGALLLKRAGELGAGTWRVAWVCNTVGALVFSPLVLLGGTLRPAADWAQPAVVALLYVIGQFFTFRSLQVGDVTVATPVLGLKVLLVALFTAVVLAAHVPVVLWMAAALSTAGIALLNTTRSEHHHHVGITIALASTAAAAYALFDVLVQKWSPAWGMGRFLPVMMGFVALYSFGLRLACRDPGPVSQRATPWLVGGALCLALQSMMFVCTIAMYGRAATANVLYSSRGLWSVVGVWLIGHWFSNREQHLGGRVLATRLAGALLLMAAIALVLLKR